MSHITTCTANIFVGDRNDLIGVWKLILIGLFRDCMLLICAILIPLC